MIKKHKKFTQLCEFFENELMKNCEFEGFLQIRWNGKAFYSTISFVEIVDEIGLEDVIVQVQPIKLIDSLGCAECVNEFCEGGGMEEKIEHVLFDFFEEPELFIREEFIQKSPDFLW